MTGSAGIKRKVLFIAYHYPPIQSTGVERTVKFLRYLPEFGYGAQVLTTSAFGGAKDEGVVRAWEPLSCYRRLFNQAARKGEAPSSLRTDPGALRGLVRGLRRWVLVPDGQVGWLPAALWRGLRQLRQGRFDLIYSTYPPASAHLLGWLLKALTGVAWVADFRDGWTHDPLDPALLEVRCRLALERQLEGGVVRGADQVIAATSLSAEFLRQTYGAKHIQVITNGFDQADLGEVVPPPLAGPLRIVHAGSFSHSHPQRSPAALFAALKSLIEAEPVWCRRLRLVLVGPLSAAERQAAEPFVDVGMVELTGPVSRGKALALLGTGHALLLVDHPRPWPATNVPGKFYEYLAMGRPIVALCGPGMVAGLIEELGAGLHLPADNPPRIRAGLVALWKRFEAGDLQNGQVGADALAPFERRRLTGQLAACFDRVLAHRRGR